VADRDNIIPFPGKPSSAVSKRPRRDWTVITITGEKDALTIRAWTGAPSDPASAMMTIGFEPTLLRAANTARRKGQELGIDEIVDLSDGDAGESDGAA
jgi:hypothetical protein